MYLICDRGESPGDVEGDNPAWQSMKQTPLSDLSEKVALAYPQKIFRMKKFVISCE